MLGQETIDRVRERTNLVELIAETVKLERRGRSHVGLCPFHREKSPSFHVNEERGFYHCFGCHASGDAIKFVQETEGLDFVGAVRRLAERGGIEVVENASDEEVRREAARRRELQQLYDVCTSAAAFFSQMLTQHPLADIAQAELDRRALSLTDGDTTIQETLKEFHLGYAPYGWDSLVKHVKKSGLGLHAAERVGLLAPRKTGSGHYDRFRHRLMFAIVDVQGRIIGFSGRALAAPDADRLRALALDPPSEGSEEPAKYVNCPESPIYRKRETVFGLYQARQALRSEQECILVEGNFDVVSLHARGLKSAVAPLGTAFTLEQAKQIRRYTQKLTLLFDGDSAGQRAALQAQAPCKQANLDVRVASLPTGKDPDDLIRADGPERIAALLRSAPGMLEYQIDSALGSNFAGEDAQSQARRIQQVTQLLRDEEDPTLRALAEQHANRIAERLGLADARTFRALAGTIQRAVASKPARPAGTTATDPPARARSKNRASLVGFEILGSLLDYPELLQGTEINDVFDLLQGDVAAAVATLARTVERGLWENPEQVLAKMPSSIQAFALARLAAPRHERVEDARKVLFTNVAILKGRDVRSQINEATQESERAQREGDFERELELLRGTQRRARERRGL